MERITLDFETYYENGPPPAYSLKHMTPVEYVLDPRFEVISLSVKRPGRKAFILHPHQIAAFFALLDPAKTIFISHNALFDACIVAWKYNFVPKLFLCTLSMARAWVQHKYRSLSLEKLAAAEGVGFKGKEVLAMAGLRYADVIAGGHWDRYAAYCCNDSVLCEGLFEKWMREGFPLEELRIIDLCVRMVTQPKFSLDLPNLLTHQSNIVTDKQNLLNAAMMVGANGKPDLMSDPRFAVLLASLGVDPPRKVSPATGRENWAFAKSDQAFTDLEDHPDPAVQALVAARLGHKSTIEETRTARLVHIANLQWPEVFLEANNFDRGAAPMPIPLRYGGAHTHRFSGDWKLNAQNFPARGQINYLKRALTAAHRKEEYVVVNTDSSQIEARIVAWLAAEWELLLQFEKSLDPYRIFAGKVFGIDTSQVSKEQRFLGKTSILGLGFGLGWVKFKEQVRVKSLEVIRYTGQGSEIILTDQEAQHIVHTYRTTYPGVPNLHRLLQTNIPLLANGFGSFSLGPCEFGHQRISLPTGLYLRYNNLRQVVSHDQYGRINTEWFYDYAGKPKRIYGGALLENIVQALNRCAVMEAALRIEDRLNPYGIGLALQVHDALCYVVPKRMLEFVTQVLNEEMYRRPKWAPQLPLAAEVHSASNYGDCH
jgi:DNA polymerase